MQYIKLIDTSTAIESKIFKELYLSRLSYLEHTLSYFDRIGIEAVVTYQGIVSGERMITSISVECEDEGFRNVIKAATSAFNATLVPTTI